MRSQLMCLVVLGCIACGSSDDEPNPGVDAGVGGAGAPAAGSGGNPAAGSGGSGSGSTAGRAGNDAMATTSQANQWTVKVTVAGMTKTQIVRAPLADATLIE